ncbi:MAG: diguanylate cyclase [Spirochaetales bacterium]|nr:diguanylate cyclase [Spirochaetales bacterium]
MGSSGKKILHKSSNRLTVGFIIDDLDDDYQRTIWAGVERAAKEADVNVACFLGSDINPADELTYLRNNIFKLISPESLDGLIVVSTVLATHIGNEKLREFCRRFEPLPMVSLGFLLEGITTVLVENQLGFKSIMDHLIEDHGYRKFLYIGGTLTNADSAARKKIFIESLQTHGIAINQDLITRADFQSDKAYRIITDALDKKLEFEAVVSANDEMAIAAMKALRDRDIILPDQVAITGFDDITSARYLILPLTTVRQPIFEISKRALELLLKKINKKPVKQVEHFKTKVIIRRSCGCLSAQTVKAGGLDVKPSEGCWADDFQKIRTTVFQELKKDKESALHNKEIDLLGEVMEAFHKEICGNQHDKLFVTVLDKALRLSSPTGIDDAAWENFISALRKAILPYFTEHARDAIKVENMLHQARVMIKNTTKQQLSDLRLQLADKTQTLQFVIDTLIGSFDVPTLLDNLAQELPRIGIKSCYVSIHSSKYKIYEEACLLLAFNETGRIKLHKDGCLYPAKQLLPKRAVRLKRRYNLIFQPLIFRQEEMGFIALEYNPLEEISSLALSEQIRSSLKASMMMQEILEKDKKLSDLDRLKNDFIANITHDFRSHLTVVLNSAKLGLDSEKPEKRNQVKQRYNIIYNASLKLKTAIDRLLDLAKMDALGLKLNIQKIDIVTYIESIVNFYESATAGSQITIQSRLPSSKINNFYTDTDKLEEIMHNLISNALKFVDPQTGVITIALTDKESSVEITVSDNGIGIAKDKLEIIFGRFEQLTNGKNSRYLGTGIGLAFVKELTKYLRGSIRAESAGPGKGSSFILELKKGRAVYADLEIFEEVQAQPVDISKRNQIKKIIKSNIKGSLEKDKISVFISQRNKENEYDHQKGVILIADDDPAIRDIVKEYLTKAGFLNFITTANGKDAIDAVYKYNPDLIISDYNMPKMRGDQMQDIIASNPHLRQIPFLFLTVMTDKSVIQERKEKGVLTFLTKPLDEKEFLVSVDIHIKKYMEYQRLLNLSSQDILTGLENKTTILKFLEDCLTLRPSYNLSLLLMDIDNFTLFNDRHGYQAGNKLLYHIGELIKNSLRGFDRAGRYRDQEFLIVLPETQAKEAHIFAETLRTTIENTPLSIRNKKLTITASFGICSLIDSSDYIRNKLNLKDFKDVFELQNINKNHRAHSEKTRQQIKELLLEMANHALAQAKKSGKNRSVLFKNTYSQ